MLVALVAFSGSARLVRQPNVESPQRCHRYHKTGSYFHFAELRPTCLLLQQLIQHHHTGQALRLHFPVTAQLRSIHKRLHYLSVSNSELKLTDTPGSRTFMLKCEFDQLQIEGLHAMNKIHLPFSVAYEHQVTATTSAQKFSANRAML